MFIYRLHFESKDNHFILLQIHLALSNQLVIYILSFLGHYTMYIHHSFIIVIVVGSLKYTKKVVFYSLQQCRKVYLDLGEI